LDDDETLLRVDSDAVTDRLKQNPWIADADLSRRIPSTLRIVVRERVPVAVVDTGSTFWFVEGDGRVLAESVPSSATVVPVIRDVPDFVAEPGKVSESDALRNALRALAGLEDGLRASVRTVSAPLVLETALLTTTGVEIMVGEAVNMEEKSVLIADILAAQCDRVVFSDVRSIELPISRGLGE
jgi:cell division protein FtsQ